MAKKYIPFWVVGIVLLLDQVLKIWVKLRFQLGEEMYIFDFFRLHFVENEGMAFGMSFGNGVGKLVLSLLRIVAIAFIAWCLYKWVKEDQNKWLIISFSLIFAGAFGNMIDCAFYGPLFTDSYFQAAQIFPSQGYAPFLYGKVVDMFYFPIWDGIYPSWLPIWGGEPFLFFAPVFNLADTVICIGVIIALFTQRRFLFSSSSPKSE